MQGNCTVMNPHGKRHANPVGSDQKRGCFSHLTGKDSREKQQGKTFAGFRSSACALSGKRKRIRPLSRQFFS